jgi:hypothetical protein
MPPSSSNNPDRTVVRILESDYNDLREFLLQGDGDEYAASLYAGIHQYTDQGEDVLEFLITEVNLISPTEYLDQGPGVVNLGAGTLRNIALASTSTNRYCDPHAILIAHSHPGFERAGYSWRDDATEPGLFEPLANDGKGPHGSLQVSQEEIAGRVWPANEVTISEHGLDACVPIDEIVIIGKQSLRRDRTANTRLPERDHTSESSHARQALVTGTDGNARLRDSHVAVVGAGGIGSLLIEDLANEGIGTLSIIDPDVVEKSNLSRIPYARSQDAGPESATPEDTDLPPAVAASSISEAGRPKVEVAADYVRGVDPDIDVRPVPYPIETERAMNATLQADVLVAATDHTTSREIISEAGQRYLRPVFDAGSNVNAEGGEVYGIETTFALTGPPWACRDCQGLVDREAVRVQDRDPDELEYGLNLQETEQPSVLAVNRYPAARAGYALYGYLTGLAEDEYAPTWEWDTGSTNLLDADQRSIPEEYPEERCPRCSGGLDGLRGTGDRGAFGAISELTVSLPTEEASHPEALEDDADEMSVWQAVRDVVSGFI